MSRVRQTQQQEMGRQIEDSKGRNNVNEGARRKKKGARRDIPVNKGLAG